MIGYEMYPLEKPRGTSLWIKTAFQLDAPVTKPLEFVARLVARDGRTAIQVLMRPDDFGPEDFKSGGFLTLERFILIPNDWPLGETEVFVGFRDSRTQSNLASAASDGTRTSDGLVSLGRITVIPDT
jgi:hypothetical protein